MRHLRLILIGSLLFAPIGCAKKEEAPADAKTPAGTASKTPAENTPAQQTDAGNNSKAGNQQATNTPKPPAPAPRTSNLPAEFAAYGYVPESTVLLVSVRPSAVLNNEMLKNLPADQFPIEQQLAKFQEKSGIDPRTVERVTLAFWPGDGHATQFFGFGGGPAPINEEVPFDEGFGGPGFPQPPKVEAQPPEFQDDCNVQPPEEFGDDSFQGGPGGPGMDGPPPMDYIGIVHFTQAVDLKTLEEKMPEPSTDASHNGLAYRATALPDGPAYFMPSPQSLVFTHQGDMPEVLDNKATAKAVESALKSGLDHDLAIVALLDSFREQLQGPALMADENLKGVADLPEQVEAALVYVDLKDGVDFQVVIDTNAEEAPQTIKKAYDVGYGLLGGLIALQLPAMIKGEFGEEAGQDVLRVVQQVYTSAKGEPAGEQFKLSLHVPSSASEVFQTAFAIQQQRMEERMKAMQGKNNLRQIGVALHTYHDVFNSLPFPAGRADAPQAEKGKLSWRVHLLPFLEEEELYRQFKLDEAWDSEHNKALLEQMPEFYKLSDDAEPGHTQIVAPAGKGFIVDGDAVRKIAAMTDGTSNTIMVLTVKPDQAQPWTKPGGFELDPAKAEEVLGGDPKGFLALFGDGSVHPLETTLTAENLKALLTIAGGEEIDRSIFDDGGFDSFGDESAPDVFRPGIPVEPEEDIQ